VEGFILADGVDGFIGRDGSDLKKSIRAFISFITYPLPVCGVLKLDVKAITGKCLFLK